MYAEKVQRVRCSTPPQRLLAGVARATLPVAAGMTVGPWGARSDQRATGIHRGLSATLLVARCVPPQDSAVVLVSADVVAWPGEIAAQMRTAIGAQCGVPEDAVVLTATHTHSSMPLEDPILDAWDDGSGRHARDKFLQALPELARRAAGNLRAGRLQAARRGCAVARSRRQTAFGRRLVGVTDPVIDAYLDAAEIIADDGETIATLVAYGCHPTTLGPANWQFSPDYVGSLREVLEQAAGAPCLFFQGCGADRAPSYGFSSSIADAEAVGQALGHVACGALLEERQAGYTIETLDVLESGAPLCLTRAMPPPADPARIRVVNRRVVLPLRARDPKAVDALVERYRQALASARRPEDAVALTRAPIQPFSRRRLGHHRDGCAPRAGRRDRLAG